MAARRVTLQAAGATTSTGNSSLSQISNSSMTSNISTSFVSLLGGPSPDCTAVFKGASDPILTGLGIGLNVLSIVPGLGPVAKWMGKALDFLKPSPLIDGRSVYDCISGFVEEAIDRKIDEYDLRSQINYKLGLITRSMQHFQEKVNDAPKPMTQSYQIDIGLAFHSIEDRISDLGDYFTAPVDGVRDPAGALPAFATFVSTQHLTILALKYSHYAEIFGTSDDLSAVRRSIAKDSARVLSVSEQFYNKTFSGIVSKRVEKVKQPEFWESCGCPGPIAQIDCCAFGYKFKDETTGYEFKTTGHDNQFTPREGGEPQHYINDIRRCVSCCRACLYSIRRRRRSSWMSSYQFLFIPFLDVQAGHQSRRVLRTHQHLHGNCLPSLMAYAGCWGRRKDPRHSRHR